VAEGGKLTEYEVLLPEHSLCACFSLLFGEDGHFFIGGFEDGCFPEIVFLPYFALVDVGSGVDEFFEFVVDVVEGEDES
jgi:hypothetical protein